MVNLRGYFKMREVLLSMGFSRSKVDTCVFFFRQAGNVVIIGVYVDDLLVMANDYDFLEKVKRQLNKKITVSDKGTIAQFLYLEIMKISQRDYIIQTLEHFDMTNANYKKSPIPNGAVLYQSIGKPLDN